MGIRFIWLDADDLYIPCPLPDVVDDLDVDDLYVDDLDVDDLDVDDLDIPCPILLSAWFAYQIPHMRGPLN